MSTVSNESIELTESNVAKKTCRKCGEEKDAINEYFVFKNKALGTFKPDCKVCMNKPAKPARDLTKKTCTKCNVEQPATEEYFHKREDVADGCQSQCKDCTNKKPRKTGKKICNHCGEEKDENADNFAIRKDTKTPSFVGECRPCGRILQRKYDATANEVSKLKNNGKRKTDVRREKGDYTEYEKKRKVLNPGRHLNKNLTQEQIDNNNARSRQRVLGADDRWRRLNDQKSALVSLTEDYFLGTIVISPCVYCGHFFETKGYGVDKMNPDGQYSVENSVACCSDCNAGKKQLTTNEFIQTMINVCANRQLMEGLTVIHAKIDSEPNNWKSIHSAARRDPEYKDIDSYERYQERITGGEVLPERDITSFFSRENFDILRWSPCHYCGYSLSEVGLDRIDSSIRLYCNDNVVPACYKCNIAKQGLSQADFYLLAQQIVGNWGEYVNFEHLSQMLIDAMTDEDFIANANELPTKAAGERGPNTKAMPPKEMHVSRKSIPKISSGKFESLEQYIDRVTEERRLKIMRPERKNWVHWEFEPVDEHSFISKEVMNECKQWWNERKKESVELQTIQRNSIMKSNTRDRDFNLNVDSDDYLLFPCHPIMFLTLQEFKEYRGAIKVREDYLEINFPQKMKSKIAWNLKPLRAEFFDDNTFNDAVKWNVETFGEHVPQPPRVKPVVVPRISRDGMTDEEKKERENEQQQERRHAKKCVSTVRFSRDGMTDEEKKARENEQQQERRHAKKCAEEKETGLVGKRFSRDEMTEEAKKARENEQQKKRRHEKNPDVKERVSLDTAEEKRKRKSDLQKQRRTEEKKRKTECVNE